MCSYVEDMDEEIMELQIRCFYTVMFKSNHLTQIIFSSNYKHKNVEFLRVIPMAFAFCIIHTWFSSNNKYPIRNHNIHWWHYCPKFWQNVDHFCRIVILVLSHMSKGFTIHKLVVNSKIFIIICNKYWT